MIFEIMGKREFGQTFRGFVLEAFLYEDLNKANSQLLRK